MKTLLFTLIIGTSSLLVSPPSASAAVISIQQYVEKTAQNRGWNNTFCIRYDNGTVRDTIWSRRRTPVKRITGLKGAWNARRQAKRANVRTCTSAFPDYGFPNSRI